MAYAHVKNLYRCQDILLFRECFALEKVHGASAHLLWMDDTVRYFSDASNEMQFRALFNEDALIDGFRRMGHPIVYVYGEAYGRICGMGPTYGDALNFIAFDIMVGSRRDADGERGDGVWLKVPDMDAVASGLGIEVVPYRVVATDIAALDAERDRPSEVAERRGRGERPREGVVLRPLVELRKNNGERIICKHKHDDFRETATPRRVRPLSEAALTVLSDADMIAQEWVTEMRLSHVLARLTGTVSTRDVVDAMIEDVIRESAGEIADSREARRAIGRRAVELFRQKVG